MALARHTTEQLDYPGDGRHHLDGDPFTGILGFGLVLILAVLAPQPRAAGESPSSPFARRGYYFTFSRMPTYGLDAWKQIVDCVRADGGNTVILWMGGGFRSRRFPETWEHNKDHANVKADFVRSLIDYAHTKKVAVLLGITPFGYDGVNRMSLTRPGWRATGPDGKPAAKFGFHSWGYNLCPSRPDVRRFMLDYAREMCLDFYPSADGLMIESSDYAACHCKDCGAKFYDHEFQFVKAITADVRGKNRDAVVAVYPHYFTGAAVPGLGVTGARQPFDARWTLFYTPHSAHPDAGLTKRARGALWSDDAVARHTPAAVRDAARRARREGCSGYVPSLEVFTYVPTEPEEGQRYLVGQRLVPYGFGWLKPDQVPYNELPARVNRVAYREYTRNPDLSDADFCAALGKELFGASATPQAVEDALFLQQAFAAGRTWCQPAPAVSPARVKALKAAGQLTERKRGEYRAAVERVREIESRHRGKGQAFAEAHRVAKWVTDQWAGDAWKLLAP
jgi:hypothetical protein